MTYRDEVICALADSEAALYSLVEKLMSERESYRLIAVQAVYALCDRTQQLERLREQHHRLLADYRTVRTSVRRDLEAA